MDYHKIEQTLHDHYQYLLTAGFKGWDVYDGLNSRLLQKTPLYRSRLFRLAWIQLFKKSPLNFRRTALVPKGYNPKALALSISGLLNMVKMKADKTYLGQAESLYRTLDTLRSNEYSGAGWGYNFPWQARAFYVPPFKPNTIVSVFVGNALLDLFEYTHEQNYLDQALQIADFFFGNLVLNEDADSLCFGYIPGESAVVHNVNFLAASFLSRLYSLTTHDEYKEKARKSVRFSVKAQRDDGAWVYGAEAHHQWVDNFHTGFNLTAINAYQTFCQDDQFEDAIVKGVDYHLRNHFTDDALPKYTDQSTYPLDIHCFSQAILTFINLKQYVDDHRELIFNILNYTLNNMYDFEGHYFYFRRYRFFTNKISYIRWGQAWMFYALTKFLNNASSESI